MKTRWLALSGGVVTAVFLASCRADGPGGPGREEGGGAGGSADPGIRHTEGRGGGGGAGGSGGDGWKACAGEWGLPCSDNEVCDHADDGLCGAGDATGTCRLRPDVCTQDCPGACGCDGRMYCNACMANAAGVDAAPDGGWCVQTAGCAEAAQAIESQARGDEVTCTSVVRLDYITRKIESTHLSCAEAVAVTPMAARDTAEKDTGFGEGAQMISGLSPVDQFVFWKPPSDMGGVAAVSARSGITVFGGSIVWNGRGAVVHPVSFLTPSLLGPGCGSSAPRPPARGLSLKEMDDLPEADVDAALDVVWETALPDALAGAGPLLDALVLLYPPQVGVFDPEAAEWVVMVNSGAVDD